MNVFFGIEDCISFLNIWNVIAFALYILSLCDAFLLHNKMGGVMGGLMCCLSVVCSELIQFPKLSCH